MSDNQRENDFERESSRLSEGLRTCRAVMENYRAMLAGDQPHADNDDNAMSDYVSASGEASGAYDRGSAAN